MAKVKIRGIPEARDNLLKAINKAVKDSGFLNDLGEETANQIRNRTRARLEEYKQPDITEYTKDARERLIRAGNAYDQAIVKKNRSNLSMSGQLLEAIYYRINQAEGSWTILIKSARNAYRGIRKAQLENKKNNNEIKDDLEARGRRFFFISEKLRLNLESRIAKALRRSISLYNKTKRKLVK